MSHGEAGLPEAPEMGSQGPGRWSQGLGLNEESRATQGLWTFLPTCHLYICHKVGSNCVLGLPKCSRVSCQNQEECES